MLFDLARHGDAVAAIDADLDRRVTYAELAVRAADVADRLDAPGRRLVFLYAENTLDFLAAYHGATSRHAVCLLDAQLGGEARGALEALYRPAFVVEGAAVRRTGLDDTAVHADLAVLLSTSGSTGSAKLVRLSTRAVAANAASIAQSLSIEPSARTITSLPPSYSFGLSVLNSYALAGASVVTTRHGIVTRELWQAFSAHACTSFSGVPFAYEALLKLRMDQRPPKTLRTMTQAGGRLSVATAEKFHAAMTARGGAFYVMYGQTEATARMSCLPSEDFTRKKGSCGKAIPGGRFAIDGGEVVYHGENVMMGYATGPADLARGDELGGVLRTGDLGAMDDEGFLTLTGRLKRIVKIHGSRFNLDEVEAIAQRECRAVAVGREDGVVLFCVASAAELGRVRQLVAKALGVHGDSIDARPLSEIPTTPNGKPDYAALEAQLRGPQGAKA